MVSRRLENKRRNYRVRWVRKELVWAAGLAGRSAARRAILGGGAAFALLPDQRASVPRSLRFELGRWLDV